MYELLLAQIHLKLSSSLIYVIIGAFLFFHHSSPNSSGAEAAITGRNNNDPSYSYSAQIKLNFIPWGGRCRIPADGESPLPEEGCDETKGIICQKYSQGYYCGCPIGSKFLSYDRVSGECRRKPGERCSYVNITTQPLVYEELPRHVKCHQNSECVRLYVETESTGVKYKTRSEKDICLCSQGYKVSRDGLECVSVTSGGGRSGGFQGSTLQQLIAALTLAVTVINFNENVRLSWK